MKKILLLSAPVLFIASVTFSQETLKEARHDRHIAQADIKGIKKEDRVVKKEDRKSEVSYQTRQSFGADFPHASNVSYSKGKDFDEIGFTYNGTILKAFYDVDNKLVGTTEHKTFVDLPQAAQKEINKRYKDYKVQDVILYDDNEADETDMILYGSSFKDADNYFVELKKDNKKIVLMSSMSGEVSFFTELK